MPGHPDCKACQFKDDVNNVCWCALNNASTICSYINGERGDEETRAAYRRLVHVRTTGKEPDDSPSPVVKGESKSGPASEFAIKAAIGNLRSAIIKQCPSRGEKLGSGCQCEHRCARGYGHFEVGIVSNLACLECVQGNPPRPRVSEPVSVAEPPIPPPLDLHHLSP